MIPDKDEPALSHVSMSVITESALAQTLKNQQAEAEQRRKSMSRERLELDKERRELLAKYGQETD